MGDCRQLVNFIKKNAHAHLWLIIALGLVFAVVIIEVRHLDIQDKEAIFIPGLGSVVLLIWILNLRFLKVERDSPKKKRRKKRGVQYRLDRTLNQEGCIYLCYLCHEEVIGDKDIWKEHREDCLEKRTTTVEAFPTLYDSKCPHCEEKLKLWQESKGIAFKCQGRHCPAAGLDIINNGENRYSCFTHDFTLCLFCVNGSASLKQQKQSVPLVIIEDFTGSQQQGQRRGSISPVVPSSPEQKHLHLPKAKLK